MSKIKLVVIDNHQGEGPFPLFKKGTPVTLKESCAEYEHWFVCEINGYQTYISEHLIKDNYLLSDYNPTEMIAEIGTELQLISIYNEWLYTQNPITKETGWFPAAKVISI